jgi:hypothetical protein
MGAPASHGNALYVFDLTLFCAVAVIGVGCRLSKQQLIFPHRNKTSG